MICRTGVVDLTFASTPARARSPPVATAFPSAKLRKIPRAMLPGFRFLFAATMLSMSLLIFGLGAAALLRAAHESFASNSSWRAAPEIAFAQRPDATMPVLAALRVEPPATEKANDQAPVTAAHSLQPEAAVVESGNEQVAAVRPLETPPAETAKPAELPAPALPAPAPVAETPPLPETASPTMASPASAPSVTEATTAASEPKMTVAVLDPSPGKSETAPLPTEPVAVPPTAPMPTISETTVEPAPTPADSIAATRIATLGGPPVDILDDTPPLEIRMVKLPRARPDQSARPNQDLVRKRVQARRALHRRRIALRARLLLQQQQVNPFGQPQSFPPPATAPIAR
jgi:hypothetical protein